MRTVRTKIYQFDELSEEAQQNAINQFIDINVDSSWWESTYEDAEHIGLKITGFDLDRNKHATGEFNLSANEVAQNIFNEHGKDCGTFKVATDFMESWEPLFNEYVREDYTDDRFHELENLLLEMEEEFLSNMLEEYATILQNEFEYLTSETTIQDTILANEYEFTKDGNRF